MWRLIPLCHRCTVAWQPAETPRSHCAWPLLSKKLLQHIGVFFVVVLLISGLSRFKYSNNLLIDFKSFPNYAILLSGIYFCLPVIYGLTVELVSCLGQIWNLLGVVAFYSLSHTCLEAREADDSPKTVLAGTDSLLSQKDTWDRMTVMMQGRYVWITK